MRLIWFSFFGRVFVYGLFLMDWFVVRIIYSGGFIKNDKGGYDSYGWKVFYGMYVV